MEWGVVAYRRGIESLNHFIRPVQQRLRDRQAEGLRSLDLHSSTYPVAFRTLPPTCTALASTRTTASTYGSVPRLTQLWIVPRCTMRPPAFRWTTEPSSSMSISPDMTTMHSTESVRWLRGATPGANS